MPPSYRCGRFLLDLSRPKVMGIVNVTPDSFSDGGEFLDPVAAIAHGQQLIEEGADILDIGGESTRPGAQPVDDQAELARILPVLRALRDSPVPISVDTMKPAVMRAVLAEGASMINDVNALRVPGAVEALAATQAGVCLMHMKGEPRTMQEAPHYDDVVREVGDFLSEHAQILREAGVAAERIAIDPGFGFGKTPAHNMTLLRELGTLAQSGYAVLFGASRKSSLGRITGRPAGERLHASVAAALLAAERGAAILRVHDVAATHDALAVWNALRESA